LGPFKPFFGEPFTLFGAFTGGWLNLTVALFFKGWLGKGVWGGFFFSPMVWGGFLNYRGGGLNTTTLSLEPKKYFPRG